MTGTNTDWDQFDGLLGMPLPELHGMTTGSLAAVELPEPAFANLERMLGSMRGIDGAVIEASGFAAFVSAVARDLTNEELGFELLLPDDDVPIDMRLEHLGDWCRGFVAAFTYCVDEASLSEDVTEALADLREIAEVDPDSVDADLDTSEFDLFAVVEHARVAALLIHAGGEDDDVDQ